MARDVASELSVRTYIWYKGCLFHSAYTVGLGKCWMDNPSLTCLSLSITLVMDYVSPVLTVPIRLNLPLPSAARGMAGGTEETGVTLRVH